ncbi:hypothetical protein M422DRAFT_268144, partial [Sphaerobolus stellatus SS14]
EGQEVRVVGRGDGVGWAVVIREESNASTAGAGAGAGEKGGNWEGAQEYALVQESYLKLVRRDEEDGDDDEGDK